MEPKFQSSFIPRGPLATAGTVTKVSATADRSVLGTLAVFVFVLTLLAGGTVVGFEWYLKREIAKMGSALEAARQTLDKEAIEQIAALDSRLKATSVLLNEHKIISPLFDYLERATLPTVRLTQFEYRAGDRGLTLTLKGQARGYSALALQSQIFNESKIKEQNILTEVDFGNLALDDKGNVIFDLKAKLNQSLISFREKVLQDTTPSNQP